MMEQVQQDDALALTRLNLSQALPMSVREYVSRLGTFADAIQDVYLGLGGKFRHSVGADRWEYICIKFKPEATQSRILECVVSMHASEYHGEEDGLHLFWFD